MLLFISVNLIKILTIMTQALRASWSSLPPVLGGKILGYISNAPNVVALARVSKAFKDALSEAMWQEWPVDRMLADAVLNFSEPSFMEKVRARMPIQVETFSRLSTSLERLKERIEVLKQEPIVDVAISRNEEQETFEDRYLYRMNMLQDNGLRQLVENSRQITRDAAISARHADLNCIFAEFTSRVTGAMCSETSKKMIERLTVDLCKAETCSHDELIMKFAFNASGKSESDLVCRAKRIMIEDGQSREGKANIFACYAKLREEQKRDAFRMPNGKDQCINAFWGRWVGAFALEGLLDFEDIAHGRYREENASLKTKKIQQAKEDACLSAMPAIPPFRKWFVETFCLTVDFVNSIWPINREGGFCGTIQNIGHLAFRTFALFWNLMIMTFIEPLVRGARNLLGYSS